MILIVGIEYKTWFCKFYNDEKIEISLSKLQTKCKDCFNHMSLVALFLFYVSYRRLHINYTTNENLNTILCLQCIYFYMILKKKKSNMVRSYWWLLIIYIYAYLRQILL